jgi:hypothetical protein
MWNLNTANLPSSAILNEENLIALELFELEASAEIRAPLFTSNVLASNNSSTISNFPPSGQTPVIDTETDLIPTDSSYLYIIEGELSISGLTLVNSLNRLSTETYAVFNGFTYVITDETTLETTQVLSLIVPDLDSTYSFIIEIDSFDSVDKVISRGLTLSFVEDSGVITVSSSPTCHPTPGEELLIYVSDEIPLASYDKKPVHIFDLPDNITYVLELSYLGESYFLDTSYSFTDNTLINNYLEKKVLIF